MTRPTALDREEPQGDPDNPLCRICGGVRVKGRVSGLICPICDTDASFPRAK